MSLFRCSRCNCVENTAVSYYATRKAGSPALCSECDPDIGRWHGRFAKMPVDDKIYTEDERGYLITHEEKAIKTQAREASEGAKKIEHIGLEGVAKYYFEMGWHSSSRWHEERKETKE